MADENYPQVRRLKVNRGGEIDETEVIGREKELNILLRTLEKQSVVMAAERRIGKTALCMQARRRLSADTLALFRDIEDVKSTGELAAALVKMASPHFSGWRKFKQRSSALYK